VPDLEQRAAALEEELKLALVETDPAAAFAYTTFCGHRSLPRRRSSDWVLPPRGDEAVHEGSLWDALEGRNSKPTPKVGAT
jgi:hypothetical protein